MANKICRYCRSEIDSKAYICPYCNKRLRGGCSGILGVIILFFIIFFCWSACYMDSDSSDVNESVKSSSSSSSDLTLGQSNALRAAKSYLDTMPFSYSELVSQLEFEGYSHDDSVFGVSHCGANWNEQAAKKAKSYLELKAFSKQELIEQLMFDGFTNEQALYGVQAVGY